jgi:uncharacterized membrane protein
MAAVGTTTVSRRAAGKTLELIYRIGVIIKGIDGAFELVGGLLLWFAPQLFHAVLHPIAMALGASPHPFLNGVGSIAGHLDHQLMTGAPVFVIAFLIAHGVVKLVLVYCLLREYLWVYPYALAVLGLFAIYQAYALIHTPTVPLAFFMALDLVIIWLVWREWRVLRLRAAARPPKEEALVGGEIG